MGANNWQEQQGLTPRTPAGPGGQQQPGIGSFGSPVQMQPGGIGGRFGSAPPPPPPGMGLNQSGGMGAMGGMSGLAPQPGGQGMTPWQPGGPPLTVGGNQFGSFELAQALGGIPGLPSNQTIDMSGRFPGPGQSAPQPAMPSRAGGMLAQALRGRRFNR